MFLNKVYESDSEHMMATEKLFTFICADCCSCQQKEQTFWPLKRFSSSVSPAAKLCQSIFCLLQGENPDCLITASQHSMPSTALIWNTCQSIIGTNFLIWWMLETHRVHPDGFRIQSSFPDLHFRHHASCHRLAIFLMLSCRHIYLLSGRHVLPFGLMTICVCPGLLRWQQPRSFATSLVLYWEKIT